jgi:formylglycine-generating enzyme required for sulfatase activity
MGRFVMGSDVGRPDEAPAHEVWLREFDLARTPVTNAEYAEFLEDTDTPAAPFWRRAGFDAPDQPVVGVTWDEAARYADWLSERCGGRWRLPTEAEWERAARGPRPASCPRPPEGEIPEGALAGPWPVGRGTPNGFDLLDIGTVVHEWCLDWYSPGYYAESPIDSPVGPAEGERRASRGGSWRHHVRWSPPSARSSLPPSSRYADYGFRVLREA